MHSEITYEFKTGNYKILACENPWLKWSNAHQRSFLIYRFIIIFSLCSIDEKRLKGAKLSVNKGQQYFATPAYPGSSMFYKVTPARHAIPLGRIWSYTQKWKRCTSRQQYTFCQFLQKKKKITTFKRTFETECGKR